MHSAFNSKYNSSFLCKKMMEMGEGQQGREGDLNQAAWAQCKWQHRLRTDPKEQSGERYPFLGERWKICVAVSCAMPLALTSREWAGLIAMKSHLRLSMEAWGPALAHSHLPRASVGVAGLWTGKDAPGNKLCSVKFDKRPSLWSKFSLSPSGMLMNSWHCWKKGTI